MTASRALPRGLPLPAVGAALPRQKRLRLWLRGQGLTLTDLAARLGVHKTAMGKWLVSGREPLPEARRRELLALGVPGEVLP